MQQPQQQYIGGGGGGGSNSTTILLIVVVIAAVVGFFLWRDHNKSSSSSPSKDDSDDGTSDGTSDGTTSGSNSTTRCTPSQVLAQGACVTPGQTCSSSSSSMSNAVYEYDFTGGCSFATCDKGYGMVGGGCVACPEGMSGGAGQCQSNGEICLPVGKKPPETVCNATDACTFDANSGTVNNADCKVQNGSNEYSLTNVTTLTSKTSQTEKKYCPGGFKKCAIDGEYYCASSTGVYTMDASSGTCTLNQCTDGHVETNGHCYPNCEDGDVRAPDGHCRKVGAECIVPSQIEGGLYKYNSEGLCEFKNKCKDDKDEFVNGDKCQETCTSEQKRNSAGECKTVGAICTGSVTNGNYTIDKDGECSLVSGEKECEQTAEGGYCWFRCENVNDNQWTYSDSFLSTNPADSDKFANNPKGVVSKVEDCPNPTWCGSRAGGDGNPNKGWDFSLGGIDNPPPYENSKNETWELNAAKTACEFSSCISGYTTERPCLKLVGDVKVESTGNSVAGRGACGACSPSIPASKINLGHMYTMSEFSVEFNSITGWDPTSTTGWLFYTTGEPNLSNFSVPEGLRLRVWLVANGNVRASVDTTPSFDSFTYFKEKGYAHPVAHAWGVGWNDGANQSNTPSFQFDLISGYSTTS